MKFVLLLFLLSLSACVTLAAQDQLIGLSRQELVSCMQQVLTEEVQDNREILSFSGSKTDPMCPLKKLAGSEATKHHCQVKFVLENGKVTSVDYQTSNEGDKEGDALCAFLVEKCIKQRQVSE